MRYNHTHKHTLQSLCGIVIDTVNSRIQTLISHCVLWSYTHVNSYTFISHCVLYSYSHVNTHIQTHSYTHSFTCTHTLIHTCVHTHTHTHTHTHAHTHTRTHNYYLTFKICTKKFSYTLVHMLKHS